MPYVQRKNGAICGVFANRQDGYAEEWLEPDDAELVAYLNPLRPLAPWQFFAMLDLSGKRAGLEAFIDTMQEPARTVARAKVERSLVFHRDNDLVLAAQQALGLSDKELDALWHQALNLS